MEGDDRGCWWKILMEDVEGGCWRRMLVEDIGGGRWWREKHFLKKKFQSLNLISILMTWIKRSRLRERIENWKKFWKKKFTFFFWIFFQSPNLISILLTHELINNKKVEIERKKRKLKKKFKKNFEFFFFTFFSKSESH